MKFRTELNPTPSDIKIEHPSKIISIGSCFADNMGLRFDELQFDILKNPFGIIFNPATIGHLISDAVNYPNYKADLFEQSVIQVSEGFKSLLLHSSINAETKNELIQTYDSLLKQVHLHLKTSDLLIITMGTAYTYQHLKSGLTVANCHKIPQNEFQKTLLNQNQITDQIESAIQIVSRLNPKLMVLLTVSPIRHIKDGITENNLSKSLLRVGCEFLATKFDNVQYFPAYELMMDDLRDYRFYKDDLIHPTEFAQNYIWGKFKETYFSKGTNDKLDQWTKLLNELNHRPLNPKSEDYRLFLLNLKDKFIKRSEQFDISAFTNEIEKRLSRNV